MSEMERQIESLLGRKLVAADKCQSHQLHDLPESIMTEVRLLAQYSSALPVVLYLKGQTNAGLFDICKFGQRTGLFTAGEPGDD